MAIFAIHIADGVLAASWCAIGYVVAAALAVVGAWRLRDDEIPRIALVTAVFFVASQIHVSVGASSVHLLLNGLVGVVLGRRALMAIPVGLLLQVGLFGHGGFSSLGINSCVLAIPALLAAGLYAALRAIPWDKRTAGRWLLVHLSVFVWTMFAVYGVALLWGFQLAALPWWTHLAALAGSLLVASVAGWYERKMETAPEFPIGLCIGELSVLGALALHCLALTYGGMSPSANQFGQISVSSETHAVAASVSQDSAERPGWRALALFVFIVHVPIAAVEALILGFLVGFLARVKPELIGWPTRDETACTAQSIA